MAGLMGQTRAPALRVVEFGGEKGRGVVPSESISKGDFVCESIINHSSVRCNLKAMRPLYVKGKWRVAIGDIAVGQELTYDYGVLDEEQRARCHHQQRPRGDGGG